MKSLNPKKRTMVQLPDMLVDEDLIDKVSINVIQARQFPKDTPDFVMFFQVVNGIIAKQLKDPGSRILLYLMSLQQFGNHIGINKETLAEDLHIGRTSAWRGLKQLKKLNIILDYNDPQDNRRKVYIINPRQSWKGKLKPREKLLNENPMQFRPFKDKVQREPLKLLSATRKTNRNK